MQIKKLSLTNFRNHIEKTIEFKNGINFIYGNNARGKTNIIESIFFFASTKSFQTSKETESINESKESTHVKMTVEKKYGTEELKMSLDKFGKKIFYTNGEKLSKISKMFGSFCAVLFSPDHMKIVKNAPDDRRKFIDTAISQLSGMYFELLNRYEKILNQRNRALKNRSDKTEIEVWNEELANYASKIIFQRQKFVEKFEPYAAESMKYLSNGKEDLKIKYQTEFTGTVQEIKQKMLEQLKKNETKDFELGFTTIGPQKDDLLLIINEKDAKAYASQGQQRTILLALKLAEYSVLENETGETPVLLLDDVFSELDSSRSKLLFEKVKEGQTIITGTKTKQSKFLYNKIKL